MLDLDELNKPTRGQELIAKMGSTSEEPSENPEIDLKDGVEVIDVKAISKDADR